MKLTFNINVETKNKSDVIKLVDKLFSGAESKPQKEKLTFDFEFLYNLYPKKIGKAKGLKKCETQIKSQDDYDNLWKAILNYAKHCDDNDLDKKFIKQFDTFMNDHWKDWVVDTDTPKFTLTKDDLFGGSDE